MPPTIFSALCGIVDALDSAVRSLEPGPVQDRLSVLVLRLDEVVERTVGVEQPMTYEEGE